MCVNSRPSVTVQSYTRSGWVKLELLSPLCLGRHSMLGEAELMDESNIGDSQ